MKVFDTLTREMKKFFWSMAHLGCNSRFDFKKKVLTYHKTGQPREPGEGLTRLGPAPCREQENRSPQGRRRD